jgi:catechol 2,3-dioxygenase-like lactoylglutathione lyase family enzyme
MVEQLRGRHLVRPVLREFGQVAAQRQVDVELAELCLAQHQRGGELLGQRADQVLAVGARIDAVDVALLAQRAEIHHVAALRDQHRAAERMRARAGDDGVELVAELLGRQRRGGQLPRLPVRRQQRHVGARGAAGEHQGQEQAGESHNGCQERFLNRHCMPEPGRVQARSRRCRYTVAP